MSTREFCLTRRKAEIPTFTKVLKAVPQAKRDYRPAPQSGTAGELAAMLAASEAALLTLLETGTVQWQDPKAPAPRDRKSTRLNSSHSQISYAVFCLKKKKNEKD